MTEAELAQTDTQEVARIWEFQRQQLARLQVRPIVEVIPPDIQKKLSPGLILSVGPSDESRFTDIYQAPNGISVIVTGEIGNPTIQPKARIEHLYYIDRRSGNAVDLAVLWGGDAYPEGQMSVWRDQRMGENHYDPESKAVLITGFDFTNREIGLRAHHTLLHELGHQSQDRYGYFEETWPKLERVSTLLDEIHMLPDKYFLRDVIKIALGKRYSQESQQLKDITVFVERNAHAFAVALVRKLRVEGIDLTRGAPDEYLKQYIETTLESYERKFGHLPGDNFSQRGRKKQRIAGNKGNLGVRGILRKLAKA